MPFGVYNGPATFQRLMQVTMSDLIFQILLVYLDNILFVSETFEQHLERLETVFQSLADFPGYNNNNKLINKSDYG